MQTNPWEVSFARLFDMSTDSGLFRTAAQLKNEGWRREGTDWSRPSAHAPRPDAARPAQASMDLDGSDTRSLPLARAEERMVPLYEAKMIHQMDHRWATYDGDSARDATPMEKADPAWEPMPRHCARASDRWAERLLIARK